MHELFTQVLSNKDLSKAGDLFSVADSAIVDDLTEVVETIAEITALPDYVNNDNDQSVVEIIITRVTSAIRETGSIERHAEALVALLESCLSHNLKPSTKDEDPPHAKISSDIISCIFLNYSKKELMRRALPVAVKFLHKGNKELSRNMASYLSLAAIDNADLLSMHIQLIIDSIIAGNYPLCRVLPQIYAVTKEPIHDHAMALASLLPLCDHTEQLALLQLFALIANNKPELLEASLPQLCEYLGTAATANATMVVLLHLAEKRPHLLVDYVPKIKQAADRHPNTLCLAAQIIAAVGKLSKDRAQEALNFVLEHLGKADRGSQGTLIKEATLLCSSYPVLFTDKMLAQVMRNKPSNNSSTNQVNQISGVTIVKVGGQQSTATTPPSSQSRSHTNSSESTLANNTGSNGSMTAANLNSSMTAGHLNGSITAANLNGSKVTTVYTSHNHGKHVHNHYNTRQADKSRDLPRSRLAAHRSMTRLNVSHSHYGGSHGVTQSGVTDVGSVGQGLHKSMTRLTPHQPAKTTVTTIQGGRQYTVSQNKVSSGGVTVTTKMSSSLGSSSNALLRGSSGTTDEATGGSHTGGSHTTVPPATATTVAPPPPSRPLSVMVSTAPPPSSIAAVPRRAGNRTSVTIINNNNNNNNQNSIASQRISVFEPYPMRDTVQHFCEKHLDKIKSYMEKVSVRIPPPAKCTIEERRAKKLAKLHFACQGRGEHCLYSRTFFTMRTRNPRVWIHLMFLALQARSQTALSSRDSSVSSLKNCWDILKCENKTFLTLVTSAFPCAKDQDAVLNELRQSGFCDMFSRHTGGGGGGVSPATGGVWGCFLCCHPERAVGFLQDSQPVIEGQLKEKKGRWKIFRRWRTRYFTLSGAHLSYKGSKDDKEMTPIDVHQIRSVKVSRGARNIPKAFEIFTGDDESLILKPKDGKNAEEWVQCLSVVVAHSQAKDVPNRASSLNRTSV
ncbi:protein melted [Nilaparvata lugens]|uniref:protein melted n=1 Tax=Nilaparvata lugens TaxID=108931 RepID=UPI00193EA039|nr:protein melted [Nilaparvata lugens]